VSRRAQGLRAWLWQRGSAIYLLVYVLVAGVLLLWRQPSSHEAWRAWMAQPAMTLATAVFFWALLIHAWVGGRDVLIDYARPLSLRLALLAILGLMLGASGLWALKALLTLHLGS
jgi:succinate dehydrogenase / fumarate reductase membrane anchor subunit